MDEKITILCVDDEKNVLKALERLFFDSDYEIVTATSGEEGLKILKNTDPVQLIIVDYRMPGMNGVDFLRNVCEIKPESVRIVLSGYADTGAIVDSINEGQIYKFIPKPWNDDELKVTIAKAIEHYFASQKNIQLARELEAKSQELRHINENLERLVEERSADVIRQNRILTCSHNILDSLPVAVVGIDSDGMVIQCNKKCMDLLSSDDKDITGMDRREALPEGVNGFVEQVLDRDEGTAFIPVNGTDFIVRGAHMKHQSGQEGIVLMLDKRSKS